MQELNLGGQWDLYFAPEDGALPQTPQEVPEWGMKHIKATVPGNVELDLMAAGLEEDPFYATNTFNYRKYEFYTWWFIKTIEVPASFMGQKVILRFEGLDTYCDIWIDDVLVKQTDNMLISHEVDVTEYVTAGSRVQLSVHVTSAVNHARKAYYPMGICTWSPWGQEFAKIRKAPHSFGWDISGRLLSAGIWRDVTLYALGENHFIEVYCHVLRLERAKAVLGLRYRFATNDTYMQGLSVEVEGKCGDSTFKVAATAMFNVGSMEIEVPNPKLWWPVGYGEAHLYDVTVTLKKNEAVLDTFKLRTRIRTVDIEQRFDMDNQQFLIKVNDTPIMSTSVIKCKKKGIKKCMIVAVV